MDHHEIQRRYDAALERAKPGPVPSRTRIERWDGILPPLLLRLWGRIGLGTLAEGRLRLIDPDLMAPPLDFALRGDPVLGGDRPETATHGIAIDPFGSVVLWSPRAGIGVLALTAATVEMPFLNTSPLPHPDAQLAQVLLGLPTEAMERLDPDGAPLLDRLAKLNGPLAPGQIYGVLPAPPEPGRHPAEAWRRVDAPDYAEAMLTAVGLHLIDPHAPEPMVREIGAAAPAHP